MCVCVCVYIYLCVFVRTGAGEEGSHPGQEGGHADREERAGDQEDALQHHAQQGRDDCGTHRDGLMDLSFFHHLTVV